MTARDQAAGELTWLASPSSTPTALATARRRSEAPNLTAAEQDVVWAAYTAAVVGVPDHAELASRVVGCSRCGYVTAAMRLVGQVIARQFIVVRRSWAGQAGQAGP
ncbi:hypothetical protein [Rhodococcus opacus]|nr:hypothetical protein [Rhodococcus opacus]